MKRTITLISLLGICLLGFFVWDKSAEKPVSTKDSKPETGTARSLTPLEMRRLSQNSTAQLATQPLKSSRSESILNRPTETSSTSSTPKDTSTPKESSSPNFIQFELKSDVERLDYLTSKYATASYPKLRQAVVDLGNSLRPSEYQQLANFLEKTKRPKHVGKNIWFALQNEIMNKLRSQKPAQPGLGKLFVRLATNMSLEDGTREYALQHLAHWQSQIADAEEKAEIQSFLVESARQEKGARAGSALLAAYRAARADRNADKSELVKTAFAMANDAQASVSVRTTALAICADENHQDALPLARALANQDNNFGLRLAAISALAKLGAGEELSILKTLSDDTSAHPVVQRAAKTALTNLQRRMISESNQS
jgi:hypothetical protein